MNFRYPEKIRFKCKRCALCCGDTERRARTILMLKIEADRISEETLKNIDEFAERIEDSEPYTYRMKKNTERKCVFLKDKTCAIYQIRPLICRFYPFEFTNAGNSGLTFIPTDECPCIGKGLKLDRSYFDRLFERLTRTIRENSERRM